MSSTSHPTFLPVRTTAAHDAAATLGELFAKVFVAVAAGATQVARWYRQRRRAGAVYVALRELDDHMLRDLGFHRSELGSIAAEVSGAVEPTRIRTQPSPPAAPARRRRSRA